ncbi:MAG: (Fe-S)-binding protein [Promethearchaeota archaeon]
MSVPKKSYMDCCDWSQCTKCGDCFTMCPVLKLDKDTAVLEIEQLLDGKVPPNINEKCTLCFNCNQYCPQGLRPHELILQRIIENRNGKIKYYLAYMVNGMVGGDMFRDYYSKMTDEEKEILEKWSQIPPKGSKDILWIGCLGKMICKDIDNSKVLKDLPKFGPPDICCGELAYRLVGWECYSAVVEKTLKRFEQLDIERMVCYCASCYNFFSNILPNVFGKKLPFKLISLYEWLLEQYEAGALEVKKPLKYDKLAVSESCYVSELGEDFQKKLRKIYEIAGAKLVELPHHGNYNLSCGMVSIGRNMSLIKGALRTSRAKYKDLKKSGTKDIALNCPGCYLGLKATNFFKLPWNRVKKMHYMPDELLEAFGDDLETPLSEKLGEILKVLLRKRLKLFRKIKYDSIKIT